jgi:DNA-binding beta-propeller fold protein YncE
MLSCSCSDDGTSGGKDARIDADGQPKHGDGITPAGDGQVLPPCTKTGEEVCDGVDNDCNGKVDEGYALLCAPCTGAGASCIEAKLTGGGYWAGAPRNLTIGDDQGIALPALPKAQPYIYIANSGDNTVSKIRTSDAVEVGRFLVGNNPSRTAVDGRGDAWIAMRGDISDDGSGPLENVVKLAGDCIPKVKPPTPTRECILLDVPKVGNLLRGIAVDARNNIWVGAYATQEAILLDGQTGVTLTKVGMPGHPYGIAMDENGYLWVSAHSATYASGSVYRVDPVLGQVDVKLGATELENHATYGLAADGEGGIWYAAFGSAVFRVDAVTGVVGPIHEVGVTTRGVAVDDKGFLWAADSSQNALLKIDRKTGTATTVTVGTAPVGVAVDHDGNIWSVNQGSGNATKVAPDGTVLKTVTVGNDPYTYSDMTGAAYRIFKKMKGVFTGTYETGIPGAKWRSLSYVGNVPSPSTVAIRVRSSDGSTAKAVWQDVTLSGKSATLSSVGANLELEVKLATEDRLALPNIESFTFKVER